jgi:hypothetical protein
MALNINTNGSTIRTNWTTDRNQQLLKRYQEMGLIPFSCVIEEVLNNDSHPKKELKKMPQHGALQAFDNNLIKTYNGLCLKMGIQLKGNDEYLILIDVDNKNGTMAMWQELLQRHQKIPFRTPTATTGNNGLHYLFKVSHEQLQQMQSAYTGLMIDGVKYDIDVKARNGVQLAQPTRYTAVDGSIKKYQWIKDTIYKYDIMKLPQWLYSIIINSNNNSSRTIISRTPTATITAPTISQHQQHHLTMDLFKDLDCKPSEDDLEYFNTFSFHRLDNNYEWIRVAFLCHSLYDSPTAFLIWDPLSRISPKYSYNVCRKRWDSYISRQSKKFSRGSLIKWAQEDNPEQFDIIRNKSIRNSIRSFQEDPFIDDDNNNVIINQRYLLDKEKKLEDDANAVATTVNDFFNTNSNRSLNIRSPYDTGKTQLLKEIMTRFNPKRVLWLSTRITYTCDILKNFENAFNFEDYHKHKYTADRIIIQVESVLKLNTTTPFDDEEVVPVYDLIVLDEIESILKQFSSAQTFKHRARDTYRYLQEIINVSIANGGRIISLDSDLSNRGMHFIKQFGKPINIINNINFNTFKFNITSNRQHFENEIYKALDNKLNIVIPTMTCWICKSALRQHHT